MAQKTDDLPGQAEVEQALLELLQHAEGPIRPLDAYRALAETFDLTPEQRTRSMAKGGRNHWENRVQWARNELVKRGAMRSRTRGEWALASTLPTTEDWSKPEVEQLVADYFQMLLAGAEGRGYSTVDHLNQLTTAVRRPLGEVEQKYKDVSAILEENGYPRIRAYSPDFKYERNLLPSVVLPYLEKHGAGLERALLLSPIATPAHRVFVSRPPLGLSLAAAADPIARKFDIAKRDAKNRELGSAGEEFVMSVERDRLVDVGRPDLARDVERVSESRGDGLGYDIHSRDLDGCDLYIEVKTTRAGVQAPFYVTETERRVAEQLGSAYRLYRVFNFDTRPQIFVLTGPLEQSLELRPVAYRAGVLPV